METPSQTSSKQVSQEPFRASGYSYYALIVLFGVYVLNFADRNILSILGEDIKRDLGISDSQLGFLYGTAFAIFYSLFGIPLGRLADVWFRGRLLAIGLSLWSAMTVVSGFASNFTQLAAARVGVGVGEAAASPAAFSMLGDFFPRHQRGFALAIYSSGIYVGAGLALAIGGEVVDWWASAYTPQTAPFGLRGWQVAFLVVGFPGLILALICAFLREPIRGQSEGLPPPPQELHPFRSAFDELKAVLPVFSWFRLRQIGAPAKTLTINLIAAVLCILAATALVQVFSDASSWVADAQQWGAIALGVYCVMSWAQGLILRDPPSYALIWGNKTFVLAAVGFGVIAMVGYSVGFWLPIYARRVLELPVAQVGWVLGFGTALGGWLGIALGGPLADFWLKKTPRGRVYLVILSYVIATPLGILTFTVSGTTAFYALAIGTNVFSTMWIGAGAAVCQGLVLPRMRGIAAAAYLLSTTLVGLGLGPYMIGKLSVETGSLRTAILLIFLAVPVAIFVLGWAAKLLPEAEANRLARARAAGEKAGE